MCRPKWKLYIEDAIGVAVDAASRVPVPAYMVVLIVVLLVLGWPSRSCTPPRLARNLRAPQRSFAQPSWKLAGRVVSQDGGTPVSGALIKIGMDSVRSESDGSFQLYAGQKPGAEALAEVAHSDFVTRFLRLDELSSWDTCLIQLAPKYRLIVLDFESSRTEVTADEGRDIRMAMEAQFVRCREIELLAEHERSQIVRALYRAHEGRALYEARTLPKIGSFHGATHLVLGIIRQGTPDGHIALESRLVRLETAAADLTARVSLENKESLVPASRYLADQLIARTTQVRILSPRNSAPVSHEVSVAGSIVFRPQTWTLWLTVLPAGMDRHYPQKRVTVQDSGHWIVSVSIGTESPLLAPGVFNIYAVLVDDAGNNKIEKYLSDIQSDRATNVGLDLNAWSVDCCRILSHIQVVRQH